MKKEFEHEKFNTSSSDKQTNQQQGGKKKASLDLLKNDTVKRVIWSGIYFLIAILLPKISFEIMEGQFENYYLPKWLEVVIIFVLSGIILIIISNSIRFVPAKGVRSTIAWGLILVSSLTMMNSYNQKNYNSQGEALRWVNPKSEKIFDKPLNELRGDDTFIHPISGNVCVPYTKEIRDSLKNTGERCEAQEPQWVKVFEETYDSTDVRKDGYIYTFHTGKDNIAIGDKIEVFTEPGDKVYLYTGKKANGKPQFKEISGYHRAVVQKLEGNYTLAFDEEPCNFKVQVKRKM